MSLDWIISLAHWFGSAVCAQQPDHSYYFAGVQLPLCARCTGMYVGGLLTILYHARQHPRAVGMPRSWVLVALVLFFLAWAGDGVNSTLHDLVFVSPYPPQNILRLITGALMGVTLGSLIFVMFNSLVWHRVNPAPILATPREFFTLLGLQALLVLAVASQWAWLLLPLSLASLIAVLTLNGGLMTAMAANLMRRYASNWREAVAPLTVGVVVALTYLDAFALGRVLLGHWLGIPI
jgi:uncharacterized membrane protein